MVEERTTQKAFALTKPELQELLQRIQLVEQSTAKSRRRKYARQRYLRQNVGVSVVQPGGGAITRVVISWDLSPAGICVFYPGYLHAGSGVQVTLRKHTGQEQTIRGNVANCQHLHSVWHAVGIKFQEIIYPDLFDPSAHADSSQDVLVELASLKGSVLIVEDQPMDRLLFSHMIDGSGIRVTEAGSAEEALTLVGRSLSKDKAQPGEAAGPFDLIACDLNLGTMSGEQAIRKFRESGFKGPILVITAETMQSRIAAARTAGANGTLQKPYTAERLHSVLAHWLNGGTSSHSEPVLSLLSSDPRHRPLVEKYVNHARTAACELNKLIEADDLARVRVICQSMKGTGAGYGFAALTEAATAAITSLDSSCSIAESITDLRHLEDLCGRLSIAEPPKPNGG